MPQMDGVCAIVPAGQKGFAPKVYGMGVLVNDHEIVTCAHVIETAVGPRSRQPPDATIRVCFPFSKGGYCADGVIDKTRWFAAAAVADDKPSDIAVILLSDPPPPDVGRATLAVHETGSEVQAYGFRSRRTDEGSFESHPRGEHAEGRVVGALPGGRGQVDGLRMTGAAIEGGFSGAGLYDPAQDAVVGIVVETDVDPDRRLWQFIDAVSLQRALGGELRRHHADPVLSRYVDTVLASFRLDAIGVAVSGASRHATTLADAYGGTRYAPAGSGGTAKSLDEIAAASSRTVLIGSAGSGKSVTLKRWARDLAIRENRIPIYLRLGEFASGITARSEPGYPELIQAFARTAEALGVDEVDARMLERIIARGQTAIALDGLDEVGGTTLRGRVAAAIGHLGEFARNSRLIVASRPTEYAETPLPNGAGPDFVEYRTLPLEDDQIRAFLKKSFRDDGSLWRRIRAQDELRRLARSPLLLTLIGLLAEQGDIPQRSVELYEAIVATAVRERESTKGDVPDVREARLALEDLALLMQQRQTPAAPMPEVSAFGAIGGTREQIVAWLVRRTGLLSRTEQRGVTAKRAVLEFPHLQIQEYLAGSALARRLADGGADKGLSILKKWGNDPGWAEVQRFAAARLAAADRGSVLESWLGRLITGLRKSDDLEGALRAARLLAQADAKFLPAHDIEARIVRKLETGAVTSLNAMARVWALCHLVPRPASVAAVREIALQTAVGLRWMARTTPLPPGAGSGQSSMENEAFAACVRLACEYGDVKDVRTIIPWASHNAARMIEMTPWAWLAKSVERYHGMDAASRYLRGLAFSDQWLMDATPASVRNLLDAIDLQGYTDIARTFAFEGVERSVREPATAGFAGWLEEQDDPQALAAVDRYYWQLRERIAAAGERTYDWWGLPLWPARSSEAADALRLEVLRHQDVAWFVAREALHDPRHPLETKAALLSIARTDPDRSRRRSIVHLLVHETDPLLGMDLVMEILGHELPDRWIGEDVVRYLYRHGRGSAAKQRLMAALAASSTTATHRQDLQRLVAVTEELEAFA